ncbi:MAG: 3-phosphoglycerate dehydrogenase [Ruminococcaceae bacterium]|nr:3-phosphoglycerate dehydrogenase [Oscillospiraceae bacterium]
MYNILTLNKISEKGLSRLDTAKYTCMNETDTPDAVIVRSASMHDMDMPATLLAIARAGAGYNNIPVPACTEKGICVFNTPGANANAVKELVICGLFLASRRIVPAIEWCRTLKGNGTEVGKMVEKGKGNFAGPEILGKTLGVYGMGAIGVLVANAAVALGMKVIGYDPYISDKAVASLDKSVSLTANEEDLFVLSDYLTLHAPLTDATRGIVNAKNLAKAKDGIRVLNFARGELVDSADIIEAVNSGKCAAYATDFPTDKQLGVDGIIAIPHLGASSPESEENCAIMAADQISLYLETGNVVNSVNLPCISKEADGTARLTVITVDNKTDAILTVLNENGIVAKSHIDSVRANTGYVIIDTDSVISESAVDAVKAIDGVIAVRAI